MATSTYTPIASITLGSSASSVTFSSIPQDYRDLVLVFSGKPATTITFDFISYEVNSDTSSSYSMVRMLGTGSSAISDGGAFKQIGVMFGNNQQQGVWQFMDYSATDKHKTFIGRSDSGETMTIAGRYSNTTAISSIKIFNNGGTQYATGSTFSLFGIEA